MRTAWGLSVMFGLFIAGVAISQDGDQASARAVIDKAIKAAGGAAKVAKLNNLTWKGKVNITENGQQISFKVEGSSQGFDRHRLEIEVQFNGMTENVMAVINGDKGWSKDKNGTKDLPAKEMASVQDALFVARAPQLLAALKDKAYQLSHLGEIKIGDQPAVGLRISRKDRPDVSMFFDKKTSLPVKTETRFKPRPDKEVDLEIMFREYKEVNGVQQFTRIVFKAEGKEIAMELSDIQAPEKLEASLFARPE